MTKFLTSQWIQYRSLSLSSIVFCVSCLPSTVPNRTTDFVDRTNEVITQRLSLAPAPYSSVAWLNKDEIALAYKEPGANADETRIGLLQLDSNNVEDIIQPIDRQLCVRSRSGYRNLSTLPDGNLGYLFHCIESGGFSGTLYSWNPILGTPQELLNYDGFMLGPFAMSPEMNEVIQEQPVGAILPNELYRFQIGGDGERNFSDFQRVGSPSWSPATDTIIFAGTESAPDESPESFDDVQNFALSPGTIYAVGGDGSEQRELLTVTDYP